MIKYIEDNLEIWNSELEKVGFWTYLFIMNN
jgi:hypothetical protein